MVYVEPEDNSKNRCVLTIIEQSSHYLPHCLNSNITYNYYNFDINGSEPTDIDFNFDVAKVMDDDYELEIKTLDDDKVVYSTLWNDEFEEFIHWESLCSVLDKDKTEIIKEMQCFTHIINKPFRYDTNTYTNLYSITLEYQLNIDSYGVFPERIISLRLSFITNKYPKAIINYEPGKIHKITTPDLPPYIRSHAKQIKTHTFNKQSFSALWLYKHYTGDIFIINVEPSGKQFQHYVVAHLHICQNRCGKCITECITNWDEGDIEVLETFICTMNDQLEVKWLKNSSIINYKNEVFISQDNDCAFINRTILEKYDNPN